jgi:chitodextrinase
MAGSRLSRALIAVALTGGTPAVTAAVAQAAPPAPTDVRVTGTTTSTATLAWSAVPGAAQYRVFEYEWTGDGYEGRLRATATGTNATVRDLMPNSNFIFFVRAVDGAGRESPDSEFVHAETPRDLQGPTTPGDPRASDVTFTSARLTWEPSTDDHFLMGYWVSVDGSTPTFTTNELTTTVRELAPGRRHTVGISARDSLGNFSQTAEVTFTTVADTDAPTAPASLRGDSGFLTWTASQDNSGEARYVLFVDGRETRAVTPFGETFFFFDACVTFFPAGPGTHTVTVRARDRAGNLSPPSNEVTVVVP